jgi:hypothetical protein
MRMLAYIALLLTANAASASVLWRGDYETGDIAQWTRYQGLASRLTVVESPVRQGRYALRVELHQGDVASSGTRNEVLLGDPEVEGNDHWYSWSTLFPADFPAPNTWQVFTQWHHSGCCGSPPLEFGLVGERIHISHNGSEVLWSAPLVRGVWHDFVVHVYFSSTSGFIEFWYDGQPALAKTAVQTLNPGEVDYLKQGLYRNANIADVAVVYHDGMTIGTSMADVAPSLAAPGTGTGSAGPADGGTGGDPAPATTTAPVATTDGGTATEVAAAGFPAGGGCAAAGSSVLAMLGLLPLLRLRRKAR